MADSHNKISYKSFIWLEKTAENEPLLLGGICDARLFAELLDRRRHLPSLSFANIREAYALDWKLSQITSFMGQTLAILGASVSIPGLTHRSGGILGSPCQTPASASLEWEELADHLYLWTAPGGPGIAFRAGKACAQMLKQRMQACRSAPLSAQTAQIRFLMQSYSIEPFLLVCDGSGPQGHCYLAAADQTGFYEIDAEHQAGSLLTF